MVQAKNLHVASERHDDSKLRMEIISFQNFQNLTGHSFIFSSENSCQPGYKEFADSSERLFSRIQRTSGR